MKHNKQIFPNYFYSCVNETKCVRLINLSSKENRYAFNFTCKILYKNLEFYKKISPQKLKTILIQKNFITQYFT